MRKFQIVFTMTVAATLLLSCNGLKRMQRNINKVNFGVVPSPLEVKGDKVAAKIEAAFPAKYFDKRTQLVLTPSIVYGGKQSDYKAFTLQGEKFAGNDKVIPYKLGAKHSYSGEVDFAAGMEKAELVMNITGYRGKKSKTFKPVSLAQGTITTPFMLKQDDRAIIAPDQFKRITQHTQNFIINYLVNSSNVLSKELDDKDVKETNAFLKLVAGNPNYKINGITIEAYASPEGELRINENLASDRGASSKEVVSRMFKQNKVKADGEKFLTVTPKGEDWEGFKSLMEQSSIADKDLILRVLTMYADPQKREQEIRNLSATFEEVSQQILPKLRRATVSINYEIVGKSDEEIMAIAKSNPSQLNVEELLYAAKLSSTPEEKNRIYTLCETQFPADFRASNNLGVLAYQAKDLNTAKSKFQKSQGIKENIFAANNLGILSRIEGDRAAAQKGVSPAAVDNKDAKYNLALIQVQNGEYGAAVLNMNNQNTFNSALAHMLAGQNDKALAVLQASTDANTPDGLYLSAIIHKRSGNNSACLENLSKAVSLQSSLKNKAASDLEFYSLRSNPDFKTITQ